MARDESQRLLWRTLVYGGGAALIVPLNVVVFVLASQLVFLTPVFFVLTAVQLVCGLIGARAAWRYARFAKLSGIGLTLFCGVAALCGPAGAFLGSLMVRRGGGFFIGAG